MLFARAFKQSEQKIISLLNLVEVAQRLHLLKSTIYWLFAENRFPEPCRISPTRVVWAETDIEAWGGGRTNS